MLDLAREVRRRHVGLWLIGALNLALAVLFLALIPFESRTATGLNLWMKPFKFAVSVGVYLWTIAWLLPHLRIPRWLASGLGWAVALSLLVENGLIFSQAVRGTTSHFNFTTQYDGSVFALMGVMIGLNTVLATVLLVLYFVRPGDIARPYLWGIRLGFVLFLVGSATGGMMIAHGGHTVGAEDGGPGLPFFGWSTEAGDFRPSHLVTLHALQVLPFVGYWLSRRRWSPPLQMAGLLLFAAAYTALGSGLLVQALQERPLIAL